MTENKARIFEEPTGYDHPPTERIPVQGEPVSRETEFDQPVDSSNRETGFDQPVESSNGDREFDEPVESSNRDSEFDQPVEPANRETEPEPRIESARPVASVDESEEDRSTRDDSVIENTETVDLPARATGSDTAAEPAEFFDEHTTSGFQDRWRELQSGFVDDPSRAVHEANDLVDEIMRELAGLKQNIESRLTDDTDTEQLRVVIREYRAFFNHLLNA
jgi:hypothetical protein